MYTPFLKAWNFATTSTISHILWPVSIQIFCARAKYTTRQWVSGPKMGHRAFWKITPGVKRLSEHSKHFLQQSSEWQGFRNGPDLSDITRYQRLEFRVNCGVILSKNFSLFLSVQSKLQRVKRSLWFHWATMQQQYDGQSREIQTKYGNFLFHVTKTCAHSR